MMDRILLGQLSANGDCLYATILARQLRQDFPKAHITWAVSRSCMKTVANNPDVDEFWQLPAASDHTPHVQWLLFEREALKRYTRREFDHVLLSQIWPNNFHNYDGTIRPSILRSYGKPITVPITNVIRLTDAETERVDAFALANRLADFEHRILFECSPKSGQSFITPDMAQAIAADIYAALPETTVIFNSHLPITLRDPRSRASGSLSLREFAHLTRYATLFVGVGSGGSVAATSTAAQPLPMIQIISTSNSVYASFLHDFEYFGINDRTIIEMTRQDLGAIAACIVTACREQVDTAKAEFEDQVPIHFMSYLKNIDGYLVRNHRYIDAARSLTLTADRYGWTTELIAFAQSRVLSGIRSDPSWIFSSNRRVADEFRAVVEAATRDPHPVRRQHPMMRHLSTGR